MGHFTIYKDNYVDSTVVSNRFIDEYMKDANDAQLKIYLYLIRMMSANLSTSVSEIADKFNHTEKDVMRALKYWEKHQLLSLDYDEAKTLVGIHLQDPSVAPAPVSQPSAQVLSLVPRPTQETRTPEADPYAKPSYSLDQLRTFRERQETEELFFVAETYLGKPLSPSDMRSILYFSDHLHFSNDLIDYLIQYCVERGKKSFKYIEAVAIGWAKEGITTPKQAQKYSAKYDKSVYDIMKALGRDGSPTEKEISYISRWTKEYDFSSDIIQEACDRTVLATDKHRFEYADSILRSWKQENVHHRSDIQKIDDLYQKRRAPKPAVANYKFNQFSQHDYDFDALEKEILSN
ncbi:MAG: DnaD domain protein [Lachnospiraceae bacterium]|nr:DnaD domain protein [Lachnospiraceae bacterium]